jgi:hypothetical protein
MNQTLQDASTTSFESVLPTEAAELRQAIADSFVAGAVCPDGAPGRARPHQVCHRQQQRLLRHTQNKPHCSDISTYRTPCRCSNHWIHGTAAAQQVPPGSQLAVLAAPSLQLNCILSSCQAEHIKSTCPLYTPPHITCCCFCCCC